MCNNIIVGDLLDLVKLSFRKSDVDFVLTERLLETAKRQGVASILLDALSHKTSLKEIDRSILLKLIGYVTFQERIYKQQKSQIESLAKFYAQHNIKMLLLKGYGCSLCYPLPEHRPTGDIDIFLFGRQEEADTLVERELGIKVHHEYHKHSTFNYHGVEVENHAKFIDDVSHKSNIRFERTLMSLLNEEGCIESPINNVLLPPPTFNALFLLRHTGEHFASNEITLRHVLDVGTFFQKYHAQIDWVTVFRVYKRERMLDFFSGIATICVKYLGMDATCFASIDGCFAYRSDTVLADRILTDIFDEKDRLPMSTVGIDTIGKKLHYGIAKSLRWWHNRWKYRLVYNESLVESFVWLARNRMKVE